MKVFVFLAEGFEETEAIATIDVLRRAGISTESVTIGNGLSVKGAHGISVEADLDLEKALESIGEADMLVLPGGMPGTLNLKACEPLLQQLKAFADREDKALAAICAAPSILGELGLLQGHKATCYPGFEPALLGARKSGKETVTDGRIITSDGPGHALQFGLAIVRYLLGDEAAKTVGKGMLL